MSKNFKTNVIFIGFVLGLWQLVYWLGIYSDLILPGPVNVFLSMKDAFRQDDLLGQIIRSILIVIKGMTLSSLLVMGLLILSEGSGIFEEITNRLCTLLHPLPGIAVLPIFMLWFGIGDKAVLAVLAHATSWPLYINIRAGRGNLPEIYEQLARGYKIQTLDKWKHIMLPAMLPFILSGMKTCWARAWRALISAEMIFGAIGDGGGIGWFIFKNRVFMNTDGMFAGLIAVMAIGLTVETLLFDMVERRTLRKWGGSVVANNHGI